MAYDDGTFTELVDDARAFPVEMLAPPTPPLYLREQVATPPLTDVLTDDRVLQLAGMSAYGDCAGS